MKSSICASCLVVVLIALQCDSAFSQNQEKKIFWNDSLELSWDMFKEKRKTYSYMKAMTHSGIMYEVESKNGKVVIDVRAYFIYGKSWVMKGYKEPQLLAHEQIHFHISEIFSRKLDKLCETYRVSDWEFSKKNYGRALQKDFDRIFNEMDAYQQLYDKETEHGTVRSKQKEWQEKVESELEIK